MNEKKLNKKKLEVVILYFLNKCHNIPTFGKTVIFKFLYFSDFNFYELHESYLTGESYRKLEHGPAPIHFDAIISDMKKRNLVRETKVSFHGKTQIKFIPLAPPDLGILNANEMDVLNNVIMRFSGMTGTQISAYSHNDVPWKTTGDKKIIDYELVFYRDDERSVREYNTSEC